MYLGLGVKYPLVLSDINETRQIFGKYVGAELFHADGQTDMAKPSRRLFVFHRFANTPKNAKNIAANATNPLLPGKNVRYDFL